MKLSEYAAVRLSLQLNPTEAQDRACRFLEQEGFTFLVDYGIENAHAKAVEVLKGRLGVFGWFIGCQSHGQQWDVRCLSCGMAQDHNYDLWREIAAERGWLIDEPAGDVPLCPMVETQEASRENTRTVNAPNKKEERDV